MLAGILLLSITGCQPQRGVTVEPDALAEEWETSPPAEESAVPGTICVYVCGAVARPGVYELSEGARIHQAVDLAGGFAEGADESSVNLAGMLQDGQQVTIPEKGAASPSENGQSGRGLVNINTADAAALMELPGIGQAKADSIIAYRENNGGFQVKEDIMKVSGIKSAAYEKIADLITV